MILLDGQSADAALLDDRGLNYADGVFETIALRDGCLLSWGAHVERLRRGCDVLGLVPPSVDLLSDEAHAVANGESRGIVKIVLTRGSGGRGYRPPSPSDTRRIVVWRDWPTGLDSNDLSPVLTWVCQHRLGSNPQLAGIKHLNRLEQVLASAEWPGPHYFEGLMQDFDGMLIEGTRSNVFVLRNGALLTPELTRCGIAGVVRAAVIDAALRLGIATQICSLALTSLVATDEMFICNSVFGLRIVGQVDHCGQSLRLSRSGLVAELAGRLRSANVIP